MRDNIVHQLAIRCFPELPAQDYKYAVLYINGEYWGVYNIREAHSEEHYAYHYGYDPDTVTHWKEIWDKTGTVGEVCRFALNRDLSNDDNYNYVAEHINVDSVIGWTILQAWCSNHDCNPPNARFCEICGAQTLLSFHKALLPWREARDLLLRPFSKEELPF